MVDIRMALICISVVQLLGWETAKEDKELGFIVPSEVTFAVVANQPGCPIEFVSAYCVGFLDGGWKDIYRLRNRSTKPIKGYTIAIVNSDSTSAEDSITINLPNAYFRPGEIWPRSSRDNNLIIVPLTDELREKYKIKGQMKVVKIFMVVHAEFADGSMYNADPEYKSLKKFFEARRMEDY